jgi:hypothetical protein
MIDHENERVIPLRDVPKYVPSRCSGKRLSFSTIWRWALRREDPLETFCTPGGRFTSVEAIYRFLERCSRKCESGPAQAGPNERAMKAGEQLRRLIGGKH